MKVHAIQVFAISNAGSATANVLLPIPSHDLHTTPRALGTDTLVLLPDNGHDDFVENLSQIFSISATPDDEPSMCFGDTQATIPDCEAVITQLRNAAGDTIELRPGYCWSAWAGSCLGQVCSQNGVTGTRDANQVADTMANAMLESCVKMGHDAVAGDCDDLTGSCGTYRYLLRTFTGVTR